MLFIIVAIVALVVFILAYIIIKSAVPCETRIDMRLRALDTMNGRPSEIDSELAKPFGNRVVVPLIKSFSTAFFKVTPYAIRKMIADKLAMAGGFGGMDAGGFLVLCVLLAIVAPITVFGAAILFGAAPNKAVGLGMISFAGGMLLPLVLLNKKITDRKNGIQRDLPDALDLLTVSVEAGLAFDGALAKLSEKMKGALVDEFSRTLQEIRIGMTRRDALTAMGVRCDVADVSLFVTSLVQADQLGVSIANVLRVQSESMRDKRRQRAEERAMKAPVKMMLPLVIFIFPTIFIILLGPAVIQVFSTFLNR